MFCFSAEFSHIAVNYIQPDELLGTCVADNARVSDTLRFFINLYLRIRRRETWQVEFKDRDFKLDYCVTFNLKTQINRTCISTFRVILSPVASNKITLIEMYELKHKCHTYRTFKYSFHATSFFVKTSSVKYP